MQIWVRPMHVRVGTVHIRVWTVHVRARADRSFLDLAGFFMYMFVGMLFWFRNLVSNVMAITLELLKLVVVVSLPIDIDNYVVEWVSIIRNEGTTLHVASLLNLVRINMSQRCQERLSIVLKDSFSLTDCCSC